MSKRLQKKHMTNGASRKSLERKNVKMTTEIEELNKTLNAYEKMKKMLEKEVSSLKEYESEFKEVTDRKIQIFINSIDELEYKVKEEAASKERILGVQIMLVEEKMELEKRLEDLTIELEKFRNVTGIKGKILKALNI